MKNVQALTILHIALGHEGWEFLLNSKTNNTFFLKKSTTTYGELHRWNYFHFFYLFFVRLEKVNKYLSSRQRKNENKLKFSLKPRPVLVRGCHQFEKFLINFILFVFPTEVKRNKLNKINELFLNILGHFKWKEIYFSVKWRRNSLKENGTGRDTISLFKKKKRCDVNFSNTHESYADNIHRSGRMERVWVEREHTDRKLRILTRMRTEE